MILPDRVGDRIRIGVAVTVPEPYGSVLQHARARFGDPLAGDIPPHITLLGPTVVEPDELAEVSSHLSQVATSARPFVLHLRGTATFRPISPVVFIQVAAGIAECEQLESMVRSGPLDQALRFNYHPHVTVAHEVPEPNLDRAFDELATFDARFVVSGFQFYEHGDDNVWRPVRDYLLTGSNLRAGSSAARHPAVKAAAGRDATGRGDS